VVGSEGGADRAALTAFFVCSILAGGNGVSVRFSNRELDPLWGAALRFSLAAVLLLAIMVALRLKLPRGRALAGAALFGALYFGAAFALVYLSLVRLHGGFVQLLFALVPLATLLLAVAWGQERFSITAVAGIVPALAGVAVLSWQALAGPIPAVYLMAALGGVVCQAQGSVVVRGFPPVHPVTANAVGMTVAAVLLLAGSALRRETWALPRRADTRLAVAYLVIGGSVVVFLLFLFVLQRWSASRTSYMTVLIPFVTVVLSAWLDDEPIGIGLFVGGVLILAGVYLGAIRPVTRRRSSTGRPASPARLPG
jgi:drug/metabolite transporter (DMT)-like permease